MYHVNEVYVNECLCTLFRTRHAYVSDFILNIKLKNNSNDYWPYSNKYYVDYSLSTPSSLVFAYRT